MNASAVWFIVLRSRATSHLELHWLPVCYRIVYKIILLTFKAFHVMAPDYLCHLISVLPPSRYNLRPNDDSATLLAFPTISTKKTQADRSFLFFLCVCCPQTLESASYHNKIYFQFRYF